MKYKILKEFLGSQDGRFTDRFEAGTEAELSNSLASVAVAQGWALPVGAVVEPVVEPVVEIENKAIITDTPRRGRPPKAEK